jgi:hypothetical protein
MSSCGNSFLSPKDLSATRKQSRASCEIAEMRVWRATLLTPNYVNNLLTEVSS